jgi:putative MFS transporter
VLKEPERFERLRRASAAGRRRMETPVLGPLRSSSRGRLAVLCTLAFAIAFVTGPANTFLFLYTERVLGMSSTATASMVLGAGVTGVAGLLAGRWLADRLGRRATAGGTQAVVALAAAVTYRGSVGAAVAGYLLAVLASSAYAPAFGSQAAELFPTSERGSVAGWLTAAGVLGAVSGLVAFGLFADAFDGFGAAALAIAVPVLASSALFARLPETRGLELEDTAAD